MQWKSNCYFYEACIREHLRIKGLRINNIGTFYDGDLRSRCRKHAVEVERKITYENFEFAKRMKKEVYKEFYKWKTELFRTADIEESKKLWNKVKIEIDRSRKRLTERKDKKLTRLREEKQCEGDYDVDLIDLNIDIENSKKSLKDFGKRNGGKTRRKRNSHRKRIKKTNNKRRGEKRKAECREFVEKMDNVSRRNL